ncbi:hypothetical protein GJAV_G00126190 [Gymnothorax javanicus]|nr:hypothetical protein GJAV_G00126190 [Gymnothorax javanicus]
MVKIFVGNLSESTTTEQLRALFSPYGTISECDVLKKYGFVHMEDKAEATEAIRQLHHHQLNGQTINVEMSRGKTKNSTKLHVGNISSDCTNQELRAKFEEFGPVVECDIVKDYAFVHMERVDDAMEAINGLDNTAFKGKLMSVKLSTSRLRTAPGMGDRTGCYRCGQDGHWSKECPMDQNGSYNAGANGYGPSRFGSGGGRGGGFPRGLGGDPGFAGNHGPAHAFARGPGGFGGGPGYGRVAGYESAMAYRPPAAYGAVGDSSAARAYGEAAYGSGGAGYAAAPAYPPRRASGYEDRDPYSVVDFYEKYRARPYGTGFYDDPQRTAVAAAVAPPPTLAPTGTTLDPYDRRALSSPSAAVPSYYARDRSPVRRGPAAPQGYAYERSRLSPTTISRSTAYEGMRARDPYGDRARYEELVSKKHLRFIPAEGTGLLTLVVALRMIPSPVPRWFAMETDVVSLPAGVRAMTHLGSRESFGNGCSFGIATRYRRLVEDRHPGAACVRYLKALLLSWLEQDSTLNGLERADRDRLCINWECEDSDLMYKIAAQLRNAPNHPEASTTTSCDAQGKDSKRRCPNIQIHLLK